MKQTKSVVAVVLVVVVVVERRQGGLVETITTTNEYPIESVPLIVFKRQLRLDLRMWLYVYNHSKLYQALIPSPVLSHLSSPYSTLTTPIVITQSSSSLLIVGKGIPELITVEYIPFHTP